MYPGASYYNTRLLQEMKPTQELSALPKYLFQSRIKNSLSEPKQRKSSPSGKQSG